MNRRHSLTFVVGTFLATVAAAQVAVPVVTPSKDSVRRFRDSRYGVRFRVPPGWNLTRKDRQVSTFRLDARSASSHSEMRAVANLDFNPFPLSTLSGALFYYSVQRHATDRECERQATGAPSLPAGTKVDLESRSGVQTVKDVQNIGGMDFVHGHDEHGGFCVEARDEIYTAFRKGSCYRFDLAVNSFCAQTSGALDLTDEQIRDIEGRMTGILSTVVLDWEKSGAHPVSVSPGQSKPLPPEPAAGSAKIAVGRF
jgi:hypothetical protein